MRYEINCPDENAMRGCSRIWDSIAKPLHSLGEMEKLIIKLAGIQGSVDVDLMKKCCVVACGDNGVVKEGISQSDSSVTLAVAEAIASGKSNINIMASASGADVFCYDAGMLSDAQHPGVINVKKFHGTENIKEKPAMTAEEAERMIEEGIAIVKDLKDRGYGIIATGEMGIGNTTTSSAIAAVLLNLDVEAVTGRGAGLTTEGLHRKIAVIKEAIKTNKPNPADPIDVLSKLGGFDIALLTGVFVGGAVYRVPIVIDGFISAVAALIATRLHTDIKHFILASHISREPAAQLIMKELSLNPIIHADMALGEGTGAVMLFPLLEIALAEYHESHRFSGLGIEAYQELK